MTRERAIVGDYGKAIVFNDVIEDEAIQQILQLLNQPMSKNAHVRIMPDVHAGKGCVIGYTALIDQYVVPNLVGVDIGCGVLAIRLSNKNLTDIDLKKIDAIVRDKLPTGRNIHEYKDESIGYLAGKAKDVYAIMSDVEEVCKRTGQDYAYVIRSLGTLGGGNHFCEIDKDELGTYWLIVHSGSRNFGLKIAQYHQKIAEKQTNKQAVEALKEKYTGVELGEKIKQLPKMEKGLEYLTDEAKDLYLHDMHIANEYAKINRNLIATTILIECGLTQDGFIESVHNYIDTEHHIIRKGAISARENELVVIPLNMRDGTIIGRGKSNKEWNYSAPHGAGRTMSRKHAKSFLDLAEFKQDMEGIVSSSVTESTLDESPQAYKDSKVIMDYLQDTVDIVAVLKPVWNFKDK
jgi:RNA-splicing ligase RtcB